MEGVRQEFDPQHGHRLKYEIGLELKQYGSIPQCLGHILFSSVFLKQAILSDQVSKQTVDIFQNAPGIQYFKIFILI